MSAGRTDTGSAVVERALALSRADGCVVLVEESSSANLRWAGEPYRSDPSRSSVANDVPAYAAS